MRDEESLLRDGESLLRDEGSLLCDEGSLLHVFKHCPKMMVKQMCGWVVGWLSMLLYSMFFLFVSSLRRNMK